MKHSNCKFFSCEIFGYVICEKSGGRVLPVVCNNCDDYKPKSKYNNVKNDVEGIRFDSKKESSHWQELKLLEKNGLIKNLERQKRFLLIPKQEDERAVYYVSDFVFEENGKLICEDVKSKITRDNPTYIIKRKLFKFKYPEWEFREV